LIKNGIVKEVHKNYIIVQVYKKTSCGHCKTCTEGGRFAEEITFKTDRNLKKGGPIEIEIPDKSLLNFGAFIYIVPILFFFGGYVVGNIFGLSEGKKILLSFLFMALCFYGIHIFDKYFGSYILNKKMVIK
jgi:positive regulator of sigma E activity